MTPNKQKGSTNFEIIFNLFFILAIMYLDIQNKKKLDAADLRALWKKAINQQVLLIRMEKENAKLKGRLF